ncbi:MAG: hypothetical protein NUV76_08385 [Candidatus Kuenenia sp.]|nr:hypothetical protein [Candidatus Kuenenia sp.]
MPEFRRARDDARETRDEGCPSSVVHHPSSLHRAENSAIIGIFRKTKVLQNMSFEEKRVYFEKGLKEAVKMIKG